MEQNIQKETQKQRIKINKQQFLNNLFNKNYKNIVVVTGAGISVAAGIPDFRSKTNGVYSNLDKYELPYPEAIFELDYFQENPKPFYQLCKDQYINKSFQPTYSHKFIKLLNDNKLLLANFSQNIDGLEYKIGINQKLIINSHGNFHTCSCCFCKKKHNVLHLYEHIQEGNIYTCLRCKNVIKPDITFYGEQLPKQFFKKIQLIPEKADLMIIMGTTLKIKPFSEIINLLPMDKPIILINNENIFKENIFQQHISLFLEGDLDEICLELIKNGQKQFKGSDILLDDKKIYEDDFSQCILI